jgi:hypothetical protein
MDGFRHKTETHPMKLTTKFPGPLLTSLVLGLALVLLALALPSAAATVSVTPLPPVGTTDGRAGTCYSGYQLGSERPYMGLAYDAGSRWDRFDFSWPLIEYGNDKWDFDSHDSLVDDLDAAGFNIVGILLWTPSWAATDGAPGVDTASLNQRPFGWYAPVLRDGPLDGVGLATTASSPPQGLYLPWYHPGNHWGNYVYTVVSRYGGRVKYWEMWNEPDSNSFWTGTSGDYAQLLKVGYQATKAACPDCTVLFGGLHYWVNTRYYRWVLSQINDDPAASANNYYFDVMSLHLYSRANNTYSVVNDIRDGMTTYNVGDHPIWLTETGVPVWGDAQAYNPRYDYAATQDEAAAYLIQSYANAWASGVEGYFHFRAHDSDMGEYFGLIRNDRSLRPAYVAYQVAATYLVSPTSVTRTPDDPVMRVSLWGTPRGRVVVLWNETSTTAVYTLPAAVDTAMVVDRWGNTSSVAATDGYFTFTLPSATANLLSNPDDYIIGGDPLIVVESEMVNQPPTSTVDALPQTTYSSTFGVTWHGWDNESGIGTYDVQVRDGAGGEWEDWQQSTTETAAQFVGEHDHTYYFRSRATDKVGNCETWPAQPQAHTTLDLSRALYFSVETLFADDDRDGVFSATHEITLTNVTLRLFGEDGRDVMTPTTSRAFTATVYVGQAYYVWLVSDSHMRVLAYDWPWYEMAYTETYVELALWPMTRIFFSHITRDGGG